jgi:hypothetical protein
MSVIPSPKFDSEHNIIEFNGDLISLHCHHFNCGLLKAIEEISEIDGHSLIADAAAEVFFRGFSDLLAKGPEGLSPEEAFLEACALYRFMGFGTLDLTELTPRGGVAYGYSSYYVMSWLAKYGRRDTPVCYFTCGFIAGIAGAVFDLTPHAFQVKETRCMMLGYERCEFAATKKTNGN